MSEQDQQDCLEGNSQGGFREDLYPQERTCWDDFEYIETFLPKNMMLDN